MPPLKFDASDADVILITTESDPEAKPREFRVHSAILSITSPFFRDMFSLPQAPDEVRELPRITVAEPASTLEPLLQFVYPVPDPTVNSLEELTELLSTALKYDFVGAITALRSLLVSPRYMDTMATRVFAIACRYDVSGGVLTGVSSYSIVCMLIICANFCSLMKRPASRRGLRCDRISSKARYPTTCDTLRRIRITVFWICTESVPGLLKISSSPYKLSNAHSVTVRGTANSGIRDGGMTSR